MKFNFIGLFARNAEAARSYYASAFGFSIKLSAPNWASFDTRGMSLELFSGSDAMLVNLPQLITPILAVHPLERAIEQLKARGAQFSPSQTPGQAVLVGPEGFQWYVRQTKAADNNLAQPYLAGVETLVRDPSTAAGFYNRVLGFSVVETQPLTLRQSADGPVLILREGGTAVKHQEGTPWQQQASAMLSMETEDIAAGALALNQAGARVIQPVTQKSWGGTDLIFQDASGHYWQLVQYNTGDREPDWWLK